MAHAVGLVRWLAGATACLLVAYEADAEIARVWLSPDVSVDLSGGSGPAVHDEDVAIDDLTGIGLVGLEALGALAAAADLSAFHSRANGEHLVSYDTAQLLPNGLVAEPGDVVRFDGAAYFLEFDASAMGIANGAHGLANGNLVLSFDGSGQVGLVVFEDEDRLEFGAASASWSLVYDGSAEHTAPVRALAGGVSGGVIILDQPGFPVSILNPGSYRLTSNLEVPSENTTAIEVLVSDVTIDLNGFAGMRPLVGPTAHRMASGTGSMAARPRTSRSATAPSSAWVQTASSSVRTHR